MNLIFFFLVCPAALPVYDNAAITAGGGAAAYFNNHMLTYMCNQNFATTAPGIMCTCDTTTDPDNPSWNCPLDFATTCLRSKLLREVLICGVTYK